VNSILDNVRELAGPQRCSTFTAFAQFGVNLHKPLVLVETGCYRGCDYDGLSTVILAMLAKETGGHAYSVDIDARHVDMAKTLIAEKSLADLITVLRGDSLDVLRSWEFGKIDLAYLDSFDYSPMCVDACQNHQLREATLIEPHMANKSAFLLDDCHVSDGGKAGLSAPFIVRLGWTETMTQYQRLFVRT
jgi:hypothetical protein